MQNKRRRGLESDGNGVNWRARYSFPMPMLCLSTPKEHQRSSKGAPYSGHPFGLNLTFESKKQANNLLF